MLLSAVTANFACASPSGVAAARRQAADRCASDFAREGIDLVFAQEIPLDDEWSDAWHEAGYQMHCLSTYKVRSAIIWRRGLHLQPVDLATSGGYHGSYLAAARLNLAAPAGAVLLVSVHASPTAELEPYLEAWGPIEDLPPPRAGAGPDAGKLYDADLVLETLRREALTQQVIAAGDFNECRSWDESHHGDWGRDYFDLVEQSGLRSVTWDAWGEERRTSFGPNSADYQLDHILATPAVASRLSNPAVAEWDEAAVALGELSDHAPIRFMIG